MELPQYPKVNCSWGECSSRKISERCVPQVNSKSTNVRVDTGACQAPRSFCSQQRTVLSEPLSNLFRSHSSTIDNCKWCDICVMLSWANRRCRRTRDGAVLWSTRSRPRHSFQLASLSCEHQRRHFDIHWQTPTSLDADQQLSRTLFCRCGNE
jgi:hypothetical protein